MIKNIEASHDIMLNFKSKEGYHKYLAYGHIHKDFEHTPGNQTISIAGKPHKVHHKK